MKTAIANFYNAARRAVKRGVAKINEVLKGNDWVDKINLDELRMSDSSKCICGQLGIGTFKDGRHHAGPKLVSEYDHKLGFMRSGIPFAEAVDIGSNHMGKSYDILGKIWKQEITKIRQVREATKLHAITIFSTNQIVTSVITTQ